MILLLELVASDWASSVGTKFLRHRDGWAIPSEPFILAEWALDAGKFEALNSVIGGLVTKGMVEGWQLETMTITEAATVFDGAGERKGLELAVNLIARHDHPDVGVRGLTQADTWSSERLPAETRDALLECWEALQ